MLLALGDALGPSGEAKRAADEVAPAAFALAEQLDDAGRIFHACHIAVENLRTGDLLFFSSNGVTPDHVGLYIGNNRFVHAEKKAGFVIITDLNQPWYVKHFLGARRIVESEEG